MRSKNIVLCSDSGRQLRIVKAFERAPAEIAHNHSMQVSYHEDLLTYIKVHIQAHSQTRRQSCTDQIIRICFDLHTVSIFHSPDSDSKRGSYFQ